ncbi:MAG TPA: hotdog domain-containing protein [Candidatus Acidoferrales bacterium]|nr:hotdog domain-containing protein [Candidatus Acidoferrales bacterium]
MKKRPPRKQKEKKTSPRAVRSGHLQVGASRSQSSAQIPLPRLPKGLQASVEKIVEFQWTIAAYNPELPAIFSTPAMIGMMEVAAAEAVRPHLPPGTISVGTRIEVDHLKAVPQGTTIRADARLVGNEGRFLVFEVQARAGELIIGRGKVHRAIVPLPGASAPQK